MRAQLETIAAAAAAAAAASKHGKNVENKLAKVMKKERDVTHEEMQALLAKLKELVPNMPRNKKLSKLEIIQYVIDYILDLQIALETHPATARPAAPLGTSAANNTSPNRQPLGLLSPSGNTVVNTCCGVQEASHTDKVPCHLTDLVISTPRPVSC